MSKRKYKLRIKMKFIRRLTVLILALTMLMTGSAFSVLAENAGENTDSVAAEAAENMDLPADEEEKVDTPSEAEEKVDTASDTEEKADTASDTDETAASESAAAESAGEKQIVRQTIEADVNDDTASVVLTGKMPEDAAVTAEPAEAGVDGHQTITAYDITIFSDGNDSKADEWEPETEIKVSIGDESLAEIENGTKVDVYHIPENNDGSQAEPEFVCKASVEKGKVTFTADSFSVYVIVQGPEPAEVNPEMIQSLSELADACDTGSDSYESEGFYLSYTDDSGTVKYFTDTFNNNSAFTVTTSLASASEWFLEPVSGKDNRYLICTADRTGYMHNKSGNLMELSAAGTEFDLSETGTSAKFYFKTANGNKWLQYSRTGVGMRLYTDKNNLTNAGLSLTKVSSTFPDDDPYKLNNKTYGLLYYTSGINGYGMLSNGTAGTISSSKLLVRTDPLDQNRTLYIAKDASIAKWTFHSIRGDKYALTAGGEYLRIDDSSLKMTAEFDKNCVFTVEPGTGSNKGKIKLIGAGSRAIAFSSNAFKAVASTSASWLNMAEDSVYGDDDFVEYYARKISVSDRENMHDGCQVIIYTRLWNETDKEYEFYAVDQDGNLVRVYESGDDIVWIGTQSNTLLWDFTENYEPGTATPDDSYDFHNPSSGKYLAPQISGDQVFADDPKGIELNGRRDGDYYTTILSWDDRQYDYAGLKIDTQNGIKRIASCPMAQAETFYFALMSADDSGYTKVKTVDHDSLGLTMKMVDFNGSIKTGGGGTSPTTWEQYNVMGTQLFTEKSAQKNLLSTDLKDNYPVATETGRSLGELFEDAVPVNHLFVQSIYDGSGYYQFDSTENFAHLNGNEFSVYQELGTIPDGNKKTHTHGQFMPYNNLSSSKASYSDNARNLTDIYGNNLSDNFPRKNETLYSLQETPNSYFGMEVEGSFMQTPGGHDAWGHDIIFEFVGDDDFWLYVDGELVIDLGGIHSALGGSVNYSTGRVVVNKEETTLYDLFRQNYAKRNGLNVNSSKVTEYADGIFQEKTVDGKKCRVFRDYSSHDVRIFFMERGAGASNLRMRFNLSTVTPGEVQLSKEITGTDKQDYASVKFPFQIYYDTGDGEKLLGAEDGIPVRYKNTNANVEYKAHATIGGKGYNNIYYLKPGQTASVRFPGNSVKYRVTECGVDTSMYDSTLINDGDPEKTSTHKTGDITYADYSSESRTVVGRPRIIFSNHVNESSLRTLTITKRLFDKSGKEIQRKQDDTGFKLRLYLGDDPGKLPYYSMGEYYVKDPKGKYCRFDPDSGFVPTSWSSVDSLSDSDRAKITFTTTSSGAADKLPAGYSIEIRGLLVGTSFKVVEDDDDIPVGYGKRSWTEGGKKYDCYKRVEGSYIVGDSDSQNSGTIRDNSHPKIEVHNQKGYGIRANKRWSDADFMRSHGDTYFALFIDSDNDGVSEEDLVSGSIKKINSSNYTTWFIPSLKTGAKFSDYRVREVEKTDSGGVRIIDRDSHITLSGTKKDGTSVDNLEYAASYAQGDSEEGDLYRTDTVTNTRTGGLEIRVEDLSGRGLAGAMFTLEKSDGTVAGHYTSSEDGLVTTAYFESNGTYKLKETRMPKGYSAISPEISIEVNGSAFTIKASDTDAFEYEYSEDSKVLTVKNKPFTLKAVKIAADTNGPLSGAHFALYKQISTAGGLRKNYYAIKGFEDVETLEDGIVYGVDQNLPAGTYYLTENESPQGYILPSSANSRDVKFTISPLGEVHIDNTDGYAGVLDTDDSDQKTEYTISIINNREDLVAPTGVKNNYLPYILILLAGVMMGLLFFILKRRREDEEEEEE